MSRRSRRRSWTPRRVRTAAPGSRNTIRRDHLHFNAACAGDVQQQEPFVLAAGNLLVANGIGILVQEAGVLTNNQAAGNKIGIDVAGIGSTLIGNIADGNSQIGIRVACPSNLTNNTAIGNPSNLVRTGTGCRDGGNLFGP